MKGVNSHTAMRQLATNKYQATIQYKVYILNLGATYGRIRKMNDKILRRRVKELEEQLKENQEKLDLQQELADYFESKIKQQQKQLDYLIKNEEKAHKKRKCWGCGMYV